MQKIFWELLSLSFFLVSMGCFMMSYYFMKKKLVMFFILNLFHNLSLFSDFVFMVDTYSLIFSGSVSLITMSVLSFSKGYMSSEIFKIRFVGILLMFVGSMYVLIFSANFLMLMIGWDGLGVVSYLLVIYFFSSKSNNAGMLTILSNRIGDILLMMSISFLSILGSWNIYMWEDLSMTKFMSFLIWLGCFTKSAQIPFSAWLPAAMAAPTPVSSLVHSSTLVTAGVYLLFRLSNLLNLIFVEFIGILTLVMAGMAALKEMDMKKIVALSTLSQLGLMVCSLGVGFKVCAFFHLILHAFFKALLFISVGNMIHFSDDFQDLRKINFFECSKSCTLSYCLMANLSLVGFPFMSGFFSKDLILEMFFLDFFWSGMYWVLFWIGCIFTSVYSARFIYEIFYSFSKSSSYVWKFREDTNFLIGGLVLCSLSVFGGSSVFWLLFDFSECIMLSKSMKFLLNIIVLSGLLSWFLMFKMTSFAYLKSWNMFLMWSLPNFSKVFLKDSILKLHFNLSNSVDQVLNQEMLVFSEKFLGSIKILLLKKYFSLWKYLVLLAIVILI